MEKRKLIVGSLNKAKIKAVERCFQNDVIMAVDVASNIASQPMSDEETRLGAINRAKGARNSDSFAFGIGLEGGIMPIGDDLYLCNWGALITDDYDCYTASGARIKLPQSFKEGLEKGYELGYLMEKYTNINDIRHREGAIGIFTSGLVDRSYLFEHVVLLLKGQMLYKQKMKKN